LTRAVIPWIRDQIVRGEITEPIWREQYVEAIDRTVQRATLRKLELIHAARDIEDRRIPPGNRLEQLVGDRRGQHSIRVNAQWRICFVWREGGADDVELVDYH
jgi:proteic killer suppression protein